MMASTYMSKKHTLVGCKSPQKENRTNKNKQTIYHKDQGQNNATLETIYLFIPLSLVDYLYPLLSISLICIFFPSLHLLFCNSVDIIVTAVRAINGIWNI